MKKLFFCLLCLMLVSCGEKEKVVTPPTSSELGSICTIVSEFDQDVYNISLFYTENETYPVLNESDFYYINQLGLKYSGEGSKNVSNYQINQENAYKLCKFDNAKVVSVAIQIPDSNILKFMSELRNYVFQYQVEKEDEIFKVDVSNNVISTTNLEINYTRVYSQKISEDELKLLKEYKFNESYNISLDEEHEILVATLVADVIHEDGNQTHNQANKLVGLGEAVQLLISIAADESISVDYVPVSTLVKLLKSDVNANTYVKMENKYFKTSELKNYIAYETDEFVIYDLNTYLFGKDLREVVDNHTAVHSVEAPTYEITVDILNGDGLNQIYSDIINEVKNILK